MPIRPNVERKGIRFHAQPVTRILATENVAELAGGDRVDCDYPVDGVAFVALPQIPPCNVTWAKQGWWVHLAKIAFEKYFMRKMRTGSTEPVYEKYVLKALGIVRPKSGEHEAEHA